MTAPTRAAALATVHELEKSLAHWEGELARHRADERTLRDRVGADALADSAAGEATLAELAQVQNRVAMAQSAIEAAGPKLHEARLAVLEIDAQAFDRVAEAAAKRLKRHQARTEELVAALRDHEGDFVPRVELEAMIAMLEHRLPAHESTPKSWELQLDVDRGRLRATLLRDVIEGREPETRLTEMQSIQDGTVLGLTLPEMLPEAIFGPKAVVPCTFHVRRVDAARSEVEQLEELLAEDLDAKLRPVEENIAKLRELRADRARRRDTRRGDLAEIDQKISQAGVYREQLRGEHEALPARIADAKRRLAELTGGA